jgi:hypothetical protein
MQLSKSAGDEVVLQYLDPPLVVELWELILSEFRASANLQIRGHQWACTDAVLKC